MSTFVATFIDDPLGSFHRLPDLTHFASKYFTTKMHFISDPDLATSILLSRKFYHDPMVYNQLKPITGQRGMVQLKPAEGLPLRKSLMSLVGREGMATLQTIIDEELETVFAAWDNAPRQSVAVTDDIYKLMWTVNYRYLSGSDSVEGSMEMFEAFKVLGHECGKRMRSPFALPLWVPTHQARAIKRARQTIERVMGQICSENKPLAIKKANRMSLPALMPAGSDLLDQLTTLIWAGHETTACGVTTALSEVAQQPALQTYVAAGRKQATRTFKETIRLHPPAYMLVREVVEPSSLQGIPFKCGEHVVICLYAMQRRDDLFADPLRFDPKRFTQKANPRGFLPFGLGAKRCFGEPISYFEASLILQRLCERYEFTSQGPLEFSTDITLQPDPQFKLTATRRSLAVSS